ncbi:hypothetical protein JTE90_011768 [Oedothorax gibbosus]|uniref:Uncharacterized protein n=1 Tax=Oedothorax gibbosus TaxID=931172 RepID=A0AAV6VS26_9ARAC|nr:hypothetical protein JTE90_011768 [Oedothorax gibbosus]
MRMEEEKQKSPRRSFIANFLQIELHYEDIRAISERYRESIRLQLVQHPPDRPRSSIYLFYPGEPPQDALGDDPWTKLGHPRISGSGSVGKNGPHCRRSRFVGTSTHFKVRGWGVLGRTDLSTFGFLSTT